ncbi:MAG: hypothetical protein IJ666_06310 [Ruminococcus sp.]|nr:hypothetical protein [Ruminococcus sp.]
MKKTKRTLSKALAAIAVSAFLLAFSAPSVAQLSASAADDAANFTYDARTITKLLDKKNTTYAPDTKFDFVISTENDTALHATTIGTTSVNWKWGGSGDNALISFSNTEKGKFSSSIAFSPSDDDIGKTQLTGTSDIYINTDLLKPGTTLVPGVYRYKITENINESYEGITYFITADSVAPAFVQDGTTQERYVYVYVAYIDVQDSSKGLKVTNMTISHATETEGVEVKSDLNWRNEYYTKTYGFHLKKQVTGNSGDQSKPFAFTVSVKSSSSPNEKYRVVFNTTGREPIDIKSGESKTITLKHNEEVTIWGVTQSDVVSITENDYTGDGYITSYQPDDYFTDDSEEHSNYTFTGHLKNAPTVNNLNAYVYYTNTNNVNVPTGLVRDYAPYALLVLVAGGAGAGYYAIGRKREE